MSNNPRWTQGFDEVKALVLTTNIGEYKICVFQNGTTEVYRFGVLLRRWLHEGLYDELRRQNENNLHRFR